MANQFGKPDQFLYLNYDKEFISHTTRGIITDQEYAYFENLNIGSLDLLGKFYCRSCKYETPYIIKNLNKTTIKCKMCNSLNITVDWVDFGTIMDNIFIEFVAGVITYYSSVGGDPYYGAIYHRHYQREIIP